MPLEPRRPHLPHHTPHPGHSAHAPGIVHEGQERVQHLRERVQGAHNGRHDTSSLARWLARAAHSRFAAAPWFPEFHAYLEEQIARDGGEAFLRNLKAAAVEQTRRLHDVVHVATKIAWRFHPSLARQRFASEVLRPASRGEIGGPTAWDRTDAIAGMPVLRTAHAHKPHWTFGVGIGGQAGLGGGLAGTIGLCGARFHEASVYTEVSIVAGAIYDIDGTVQVEAAPCTPEQFGGPAVCIEGGGADGVAASVEVDLVPVFHRHPLRIERWTFNSVAVQVGLGVGIDIAAGLTEGIVMPFGSHQIYWGGKHPLTD